MHRACVNGRARFHFIRFLFHRVGSFLHFVRRFFHFIGESFLFWLSNRAVPHPFVAFYFTGVLLFFFAAHIHAFIFHPLHAAILHSLVLLARHLLHVMLHFFRAFRIRLRRPQFSLDCDCRFILRQKVARCSQSTAHLWIGRIVSCQRRRLRCAGRQKSGDAD